MKPWGWFREECDRWRVQPWGVIVLTAIVGTVLVRLLLVALRALLS